MADDRTTIKDLRKEIGRFVTDRDWDRFHCPKNLAMGMAIETAELTEHFQWVDNDQSRRVVDDPEKFEQVKQELTDVLSYVLAMANSLDIDLSSAFFEKMVLNEKKYPTEKYRGKYKL